MMPACGRLISDGGEGKIYEVQGNSSLYLKIYKDNSQGKTIITQELQHKLEYMKKNPPMSLIKKGCLAWPIDILFSQGKLIGFVMPKLILDASLQKMYSYKHPLIDKNYDSYPTVQSRIGIAVNLASAVSELHNAGYVIGDFNHENIGIDRNTAQIRIVDCDSFTITDNSGIILRTNRCMPGYVAPEIINHCHSERAKGHPYELDVVALPTFTKESDLFCLAIHIFRSLMNGVHPFNGVKDNAVGSNAAPFIGNEGIERNNYVFKSGLHPSNVYCLNQNEIPPNIKSLFDRAFLDGNRNPSKRPTAVEWYNALLGYLRALKQCSDNPKHQYYNALSKCPYCEADKRHYKIQNGIVQPKLTFSNQSIPKPIIPITNNTQYKNQGHTSKTQRPKTYNTKPQHTIGLSSFIKKHADMIRGLFSLAIPAIPFAIVIVWCAIGDRKQPKETQQTTQIENQSFVIENKSNFAATPKENVKSLKAEPGETFSVIKYVHSYGLNVHSEPVLTDDNKIFTITQNSLVYLSNKDKKGVAVRVKNDKNQIGWVNETFLRDFTIKSVQIGNNDDYGNWIIKPGDMLYASQIKHLGVWFYADTNMYLKNITFFIKIRKTDGSTQIWNSSISTEEQVFAYKWTGEIKNGKNEIQTFFNMKSHSYYVDHPGQWIIEIWYKNPENEKNTFYCISSKIFELW